jgi:peptide/nickel transport system ATP-binding protein
MTAGNLRTDPVLDVRGLSVELLLPSGELQAVRDVDLVLNRGRTLGIVGESGSGKSITSLTLMGLQPRASRRRATKLQLAGIDLLNLDESALARSVRGKRAAMIFQEPMTCLNPVLTVGRQLTETLTSAQLARPAEARARAVKLLERVGISGAAARMNQYPHQFSGGQRQRLMIAMALMTQPEVLIADEPTTALDVTVQAEILRLLAELRDENGMALVLVSHNLGVISRVADDVAVMYAGQVVETGPTAKVFGQPRHPYTRGLLGAMPDKHLAPGSRLQAIGGIPPSMMGLPTGCAFAPRCRNAMPTCSETEPPVQLHEEGNHQSRCIYVDPPHLFMGDGGESAGEVADKQPRDRIMLEVKGLSHAYTVRQGLFGRTRTVPAVCDVSLELRSGETLAVVGESGCGKSTLGRLLVGLETASAGTVLLDGRKLQDIDTHTRARLVQPVFQDPQASLNPRRTIGEIIRRPMEVHGLGDDSTRKGMVRQMLERVGLPARAEHAFPLQLSGGQRQRVAIARALVLNPRVLVLDEPTSALDVSVQAQILNLLARLRDDLGLSFLFITHDLAVVRHMADRVMVMYLGEVVEVRDTEALFSGPSHPYTRALLDSIMDVAPGAGVMPPSMRPGFPDAMNRPSGCGFEPRCPSALASCKIGKPAMIPVNRGEAACKLLSN